MSTGNLFKNATFKSTGNPFKNQKDFMKKNFNDN